MHWCTHKRSGITTTAPPSPPPPPLFYLMSPSTTHLPPSPPPPVLTITPHYRHQHPPHPAQTPWREAGTLDWPCLPGPADPSCLRRPAAPHGCRPWPPSCTRPCGPRTSAAPGRPWSSTPRNGIQRMMTWIARWFRSRRRRRKVQAPYSSLQGWETGHGTH